MITTQTNNQCKNIPELPIYKTAQKIYQEFKADNRTNSGYDINNDPNMMQLESLAEKYRQTRMINDKKNLLNHERTMLYEELRHPGLTIARNIMQCNNYIESGYNEHDIDNIVNHLNIMGLRRIEKLKSPFITKGKSNKLGILQQTYKNTHENAFLGKSLKNLIIQTTLGFKTLGIMKDRDINKALQFYVDNTSDKALKQTAMAGLNNSQNFIIDLKQNYNQEDKLKSLMINGNRKENPEATEIVNNILKDKNVQPEIKRLAVWGAGKYRSNDGFKIIKRIALNTKEKDIRLREFAINSTALYLKEKPDEVKQIITTIQHDKSIFAPLGLVLNDKINGNYHGQIDREYNYRNINGLERNVHKVILDGLVNKDKNININKQNECDNGILFYKNLIDYFCKTNKRMSILDETYTKINPGKTGTRIFSYNLEYSGDFYDAITGANIPNSSILCKNEIGSWDGYNSVAHELGHADNKTFQYSNIKKQMSLFANAKEENRTLDYYAAINKEEYYAQGCEAMASVYKPHKTLLLSTGTNHTRYELMTKDPELFKFIKKMLTKHI